MGMRRFGPILGAVATAAALVVASPVWSADGTPAPAAAAKPETKAAKKAAKQAAKKAKEPEKETDDAPVDLSFFKVMGRPPRTVIKADLDAARVDAMVDQTLAAAKTTPARPTGDEEFIRRATLDVTGTLPAPEQVVAFVRSKDKDKRAALIDALLKTPEYARNWARYWRDVVKFRGTNEQERLIHYSQLEDWLADQFGKNRPWDEVAHDLIASKGSTDANGATVLMAAHAANAKVEAVEVAGEVARIFLGIQIQCAQCHDHPTDPWKREQFHEFAAFFEGVTSRRDNAGGMATAILIDTRPRAPQYAMPDLKDPQKRIPVEPKFFLAESEQPVPARLSAQQRRELAASYVVGQDNPWFAKAFVNRIWASLVGEGFYSPVDDMGPAREAKAPEVIDALAGAWQTSGYDVRWLFRTILNTRAYQREFRPAASTAGKTPFAANCAGRLRADQIIDALAHALDLPIDGALGGAARGPQAKAQAQAAGLPKGVRYTPRNAMNVLFGVDPSTPTEDVLGTIPQALMFMNGAQINNALKARPGSMLGKLLAEHPDDRDALNALYLRVLARRPTGDEVKTCDRYYKSVGDRAEVFEDILWALVNSTEFLSRR